MEKKPQEKPVSKKAEETLPQSPVQVKSDLSRDISDSVAKRIQELEQNGLTIPPGYSPENALKSAYLILQQQTCKKNGQDVPVLPQVTRESVANTLLDMVIQGLSPLKKQCYFIPYGNKLSLSRSYHGTIAVAKRLNNIKDAHGHCIYQGDEFEYSINAVTGNNIIEKHLQKFDNIDITKITGAYAVVTFLDNSEPYVEIMTKKQIEAAWNQGKMKGDSPAHKNFTDEMCKKTVVNRACKHFINTSDDSDILVGAIRRTDEAEYNANQIAEHIDDDVRAEIAENANKEVIDFQEDPPVTDDMNQEVPENNQQSLSGAGF